MHVGLQHFLTEDFAANGVQQQARSHAGVAGVFFDQRARRQNRGLVHFIDGHAVVKVAPGFREDGLGAHVFAQTFASGLHDRMQMSPVERNALAAVEHVENGFGHDNRLRLLRALLRAALAVQHVSAGHFMVAAAHQTEFDLILHVLNVESATARTRAQERAHHRLGENVHGFANARRCGTLGAVDRQKRLHQRDRNLAGLKRHHRPVAAKDVKGLIRRSRWRSNHDCALRVLGQGVGVDGNSLHVWPFLFNLLMPKTSGSLGTMR